ncbi:MAG: hypothetical protein ACRD1N_05830, partial [Terriglobia bacterium]
NLYSANSFHKLTLIRHIAPPRTGLYAVRSDLDGNIYLLYPHITPSTVSVIHEDHPELVDDITFNAKGLTLDTTAMGVAAGNAVESYALLPLLRKPQYGGSVSISLATVASRPKSHAPRVAANEWFRYKSFRYGGATGGPEVPGTVPLAYIKNGYLYLQVSPPGRPFANAPSQKQIALGLSPPSMPPDERAGPLYVVAASGRFLVIGSTPGHSHLYVYDRERARWSEVQSSATVTYARRIFGPWLATIVEIWRQQDAANADNPGRNNERAWGTGLLPNIREGYSFGRGRDAFIPGTLILDNLADDRRITLKTNEEDSEILDVRSDGLVLYRVNDEIFSAQIEGDKLSAPRLVVKDDDVPEVHWAFWSNAQAAFTSAGGPSVRQ